MSNYSKSTNFATKDSLASGNPLKVIKGTELDDEFEDLEIAVNSKADLAGPTFTGTPTMTNANITTANVTTIDFGQWTITESSGVLYFAVGGVNKMKIDSSGDLTVAGDITAFGTV